MTWFRHLFSDPKPIPQKIQRPKMPPGELPRISGKHDGTWQGEEFEYAVIRDYPRIKRQIEQLLSEEVELLKAVNIPAPKLSDEVPYQLDYRYCSLRVFLPTITLPPHLLYVPHIRSREDPMRFDRFYYCLVAEEDTIAEATRIIDTDGVAVFLDTYPNGVWLNRDPFAFNRSVTENLAKRPDNAIPFSQERLKLAGETAKTLSLVLGPRPGPLTVVPGLTGDDVRIFQQRIDFFRRWHHPTYRDRDEWSFLKPHPLFSSEPWKRESYAPGAPYEVFYLLPVVEPGVLSEPLSTVKVLPASPVKASLAIDFLKGLRHLSRPIAFELVDTGTTAHFQLTFSPQDRALIERQVLLYMPDCSIVDHLYVLPDTALPYILARPAEIYNENRKLSDFTLDPLSPLASLLSSSRREETTIVQILLFPYPNEPVKVLKPLLGEGYAESIRKREPLWQTTIKLYCSNKALLEELKTHFLTQFQVSGDEWQPNEWTFERKEGFPTVRSMSTWDLLSTPEAASFMHLPITPLSFSRLETAAMKTRLPPDAYTDTGVLIGESEARGIKKPVTLPHAVRDRHTYIVGRTRTGKSTLITNIALADIKRGAGVTVIDPHGDLAEDLLSLIPKERVADTIYLDAREKRHPIAINVFGALSAEEAGLLADNLLVTFRRLSEGAWGNRMDDILRATLQTLASVQGTTFTDIKRMLQQETFRNQITKKLTHPMLRDFWDVDFPGYPKDAIQPIISRVNRFLYNEQFYRMLSQARSAFSVHDVMKEGKILLVNLASGAIGEDNAQLLGSLLVSQLQQAAMRRAALPKAARIPFYLFVDEFQNFTSSSFDKILSEAGKYQLCLVLAHQFISQLNDLQRDAIFGNVGTMIMFPVGDKDAQALRHQIGVFEPTDLLNLSRHHALCRPATKASDTFSFQTLPPPESTESFAEEIIQSTRARYGARAEGTEQTAEPEPNQAPPPPKEETQGKAGAPGSRRPAPVKPTTLTKKEQILFHLSQARYLSNQQLIELCFANLKTENSKRKSASEALKDLEEQKKIKSLTFEGQRINFVGSTPNVRSHDLRTRDLLGKIYNSGYEIISAKFSADLETLLPDLRVSFRATDGGEIVTYWEYDSGTEPHKELRTKAERYAASGEDCLVLFVYETEGRLANALKSAVPPSPLNSPRHCIKHAVISEIKTINEPIFKSNETEETKRGHPLFP